MISSNFLNIVGDTTAEVWSESLRQIWNFGQLAEVIYDHKSVETCEVIGLRTQIKYPAKGAFPDGYIWRGDSKSWSVYEKMFLSKDNPGFSYTYGSRIRAWGLDLNLAELDQLQYIIEELKRDSSSRRAVAITWLPPIDENSHNPPCLLHFHAMIRYGRIHGIITYRSQDIFGAYPANVFGLTGVLKFLANELKCEIGDLIIFSESAHIYWYDWPSVAELLKEKIKVPKCKAREFQRAGFKKWRSQQ